jgi:hypothetical protein
MRRRLSEDRNQHYTDLTCPCWTDPKAMARFREQPQLCSCSGCGNPRHSVMESAWERLTIGERRFLQLEVNAYGEDVWVRR